MSRNDTMDIRTLNIVLEETKRYREWILTTRPDVVTSPYFQKGEVASLDHMIRRLNLTIESEREEL